MPKNVKYESPEMLNIKVFTVLILAFMAWDINSAYMGLASLTLGLNLVALSSPKVKLEIDRLTHEIENVASPIIQRDSWKKFRSLVYLLFTTVLLSSSYFVVTLT